MTLRPVLALSARWAFCGMLALGLTGCAVAEWQKIGAPRAEVLQDMGRPTLSYALPGGGERLLYSGQPAGQFVHHLDFDGQQRLARVEQVLTVEQFHRLRNAVDTRETVLQQFGPPALVEGVASFKGDIWTYRLRENGASRQAHVHIDPAGVVRRVMFTDEVFNDRDPFD
ncbi:hypothetical protein [Comamonas endophytica]|uniref:Beta-barrel assembly machine subunit BamE n=1 Tax=Comamonas endophytica TaxID=2949090 RepID=A0ABY6G5N7_9BURK|nr:MULTISPECIES: hypothetical protein [unclassified Acidovorax]MCD2512337.1 hypothetical protein [Acidovorax sp. D4N7]UYG50211.1 hypothetical protein M9799_08765 [Acidovorax sp. 5MLIR]